MKAGEGVEYEAKSRGTEVQSRRKNERKPEVTWMKVTIQAFAVFALAHTMKIYVLDKSDWSDAAQD